MVKFSSSNRFEQIPVTLALSLFFLFSCDSGGKDRDTRFNVVLVMADTLRADHLDAYGYGRATAPFLKQIAERGVVFERAVAQRTNTKPSIATLMTGVYPPTHRPLYLPV